MDSRSDNFLETSAFLEAPVFLETLNLLEQSFSRELLVTVEMFFI